MAASPKKVKFQEIPEVLRGIKEVSPDQKDMLKSCKDIVERYQNILQSLVTSDQKSPIDLKAKEVQQGDESKANASLEPTPGQHLADLERQINEVQNELDHIEVVFKESEAKECLEVLNILKNTIKLFQICCPDSDRESLRKEIENQLLKLPVEEKEPEPLQSTESLFLLEESDINPMEANLQIQTIESQLEEIKSGSKKEDSLSGNKKHVDSESSNSSQDTEEPSLKLANSIKDKIEDQLKIIDCELNVLDANLKKIEEHKIGVLNRESFLKTVDSKMEKLQSEIETVKKYLGKLKSDKENLEQITQKESGSMEQNVHKKGPKEILNEVAGDVEKLISILKEKN